jgi:putative ABC transport system permease protein
MSLALSTVIYEWRRYMAAVVALAFSGVLILAQVGMFMGMGKAFTATIDRSRADIFVLAPKANSLFGGPSGLPRRIEPLIYMDPEVIQVADMADNDAPFANQPKPDPSKPQSSNTDTSKTDSSKANASKDAAPRKREWVNIQSVDTEQGALTLPTDFSEATRQALEEPYAVALDRTALPRLGVKLGDTASLNSRTVHVRAILDGYPNINQPTVIVSRQTFRLLKLVGNEQRTGPLMVQVRDPARAVIVRDHLNAIANGAYRAWTKTELSDANEKQLLGEQIIGIMLGFSVFLGVMIGVGITSQTLRGAILANIKEFASLRALGVSMGSLRLVVVELSVWVGLAGLAMTGLMVLGVDALAKAGGVPMAYHFDQVGMTSALLLAISIGSGLLSLGVLKKSQPADLLR